MPGHLDVGCHCDGKSLPQYAVYLDRRHYFTPADNARSRCSAIAGTTQSNPQPVAYLDERHKATADAHFEHRFRHLPSNSARFGYATEEALFTSAQLSTDAVSALRKVRVLI